MRGEVRSVKGIGLSMAIGVIAAQVCFFAFVSIGTPRTAGRLPSFQTGELTPGMVVSQTFRIGANGLAEITVYPVASGPATTGRIYMALRRAIRRGDLTATVLVREQAVDASHLAGDRSWTFAFAPIVDSYEDVFQLDLVPQMGSGGVRLLAHRGDAYPEGTMLVAGRAVPADLRFETGATRASAAARLAARFRGRAPALAVLITGLVCMNLGVLGLAYYVTTSYSRQS